MDYRETEQGRNGDWPGLVKEKSQNISQPVSEFRRGLPQYVAAIIKNLLLVDLGMVIAFPTIVIPPLETATTGLHFTMEQASWFGSIVYFCQPLGSLTAAVTLDALGRKRSMIFLNLPFLIGWVVLYFTNDVTLLFVLTGLMGLGIGSIEAAILTYVGEISEPRLRGTLTSFAEIAEYLGFVLMFFLGTVTDWQTSALITATLPVLTALLLTLVPETPIWLLSRGRREDAVKALCWLRGWVSEDQVQEEFQEILRYSKASRVPQRTLRRLNTRTGAYINHTDDNVSVTTQVIDTKEFANNTVPTGVDLRNIKVPFKDRVLDFFRPEMMRPMFLVCSFFFFTYGSGMLAIRPYMVPVFMELGFTMDPFLATTVFTAIGLGGCVICTVTVRWVGKRPLALTSVIGCAVSSIAVGVYSLYVPEAERQNHSSSWLPMLCMVAWAFFTGVGMDPLPWMYLSEVFPFRGRSLACGVAAAISYVLGFIATKTYLILEEQLTLAGVFFLYSGFSIVGTIYFYFCLPETEGVPMEEIEESYKRKK